MLNEHIHHRKEYMAASSRDYRSNFLGRLRGCPANCYFAIGDHVVYRRPANAIDKDARGVVVGFPDYKSAPDASYGEALFTAALRKVLSSSPRLVVDWGMTDMMSAIRNEPTLLTLSPSNLRHQGPCPRRLKL